ncbi:MAG: HTH-type transcriptional regulator MurR [Stenotrophomonas maltophilia]|nr:MAG: HTH-type transcriptional regulator MurR [Stenotrophomonas maltophilia]
MSGPSSYERLISDITDRHDSLGRRSQDIARYIIQNPNEIALESSKTLAARIGVQSSNLVRFAQGFGYAGFSDMQRVFQSRLVAEAPDLNERLSALHSELRGAPVAPEQPLRQMLDDLVLNDMAALRHLADTLDEATLALAAELLAGARTVFVAGQLRSFPVASYLHYSMLHLRRPTQLVNVGGGLGAEIAQLCGAEDVLLAVSFRFYSREVIDLVEDRARHGVPIIAITDSDLSPLVKHARAAIIIPAGEHNFSASLAAPLCAAQMLTMAMARRLDPSALVAATADAPPGA